MAKLVDGARSRFLDRLTVNDAKPKGTEHDLPLEQQQQIAKDYLKQNGESEEMMIAIETGLPSATMRQILEPIAECTEHGQWERYWKLSEFG